jgi:hypothetical protein
MVHVVDHEVTISTTMFVNESLVDAIDEGDVVFDGHPADAHTLRSPERRFGNGHANGITHNGNGGTLVPFGEHKLDGTRQFLAYDIISYYVVDIGRRDVIKEVAEKDVKQLEMAYVTVCSRSCVAIDDLMICANSAGLIEQQMSYDEEQSHTLDTLQTGRNGHYHFSEPSQFKTRLKFRKTIPIPQGILDEYDSLECKSFVGLLPVS